MHDLRGDVDLIGEQVRLGAGRRLGDDDAEVLLVRGQEEGLAAVQPVV
jgi:hypothetical protein